MADSEVARVREVAGTFKYAGRGWLAENLKYRGLSPASALGNAVADILGETFGGLYHCDHEIWHKRTKWDNDSVIIVCTRRELSTIDFADLTELVLLTHAFGLRLAIRGVSREYLTLQFTTSNMFSGVVPDVRTLASRFDARFPARASSITETTKPAQSCNDVQRASDGTDAKSLNPHNGGI